MGIAVNRKGEALGAEVVGVDLNRIDDAGFALVHRALLDHCVIAIRDQNLEPAAQVAFTRRLGEPDIHVAEQFLMPEHREILMLSNRKRPDGSAIGFEEAGRYWHSDVSYGRRPVAVSLLYAVEIPPEGGDTMFVNMYRAYETLPEATRQRIAGLTAYHSFIASLSGKTEAQANRVKLSAEAMRRLEEVPHPMVRTHPETGRKALYVNPGFTTRVAGLSEDESRGLLTELFKHSTRPEFIYRHQWRPHDVLMWDNRCTMHHATTYDTRYIRHMHRTTVKGDVPH